MADDIETDNLSQKLDATNGKCANCGGDLVFDPQSQKLLCHNCDSTFDLPKVCQCIKHDISGAKEHFAEHEEWVSEMKLVKCQTCGAELMLDKLSLTSCCPYCGSNYVVQPEATKGLKPDDVLPFAFNEEGCAERFAKGIKRKFFAPSEFKKKVNPEKIYGIYVPSFLFDADTVSHYSGTLVRRKSRRNSKGETVYYDESFPIFGTKEMTHRNYVVESSSKLTGKDMDALLPYDVSQVVVYDSGFVRGFGMEHYEDSMKSCYANAQNQIEAYIKKAILSGYSYDRVESFHCETDYSNEKYCYALLPIYCMDFLYRSKKYMVFVNGQTGKIGTGYPKSKLKIALVSIAIALLVIGVVFLIVWFGMKSGK